MARRKILAVVPCLNEEEALPALLGRLRAATDNLPDTQFDILVVDDGSVDRTSVIARAHGARVARLSRNLGIGGAVQTGLRMAAREGYDAAIQVDGDGQHPPDQIAILLAAAFGDNAGALPAPDLVIGSRFIARADGSPSDTWKSTALRRMGITWLALVLRAVAGTLVTDPTSGFRLYGRRALELFEDNYPYDFPEPESLAIAHAAGLTVREVPVAMQERQGGASSIGGLKSAYYMLKVTFALVLAVARARSPFRGRARRDL